MKKQIICIIIVCASVCNIHAQQYTIISRNNEDSIHLQSNALGSAIKSIVPGGTKEETQYRLIKKIDQKEESLIFVEFTKVLDKILVTYETDLVTPGRWNVSSISFADLYKAMVRTNAIFLHGEILGMQMKVYQRPSNFQDIVKIDGVEFALPVKLEVYESELANQAVQKADRLAREAAKYAQTQSMLSAEEYEKMMTKLAEKEENMAYVAYLTKTQKINKQYSSEIATYFSFEKIKELIKNQTENQLYEKSKGHSECFDKYEIWR